jgi:ribosomal protein L16/L10AE
MDRGAGKAVKIRHCPATVMRNETGTDATAERREGSGVGTREGKELSLISNANLKYRTLRPAAHSRR